MRQRTIGLPEGAQLPSTRELVAELGVSPVTVRAAIARLVADGVVETRPGTGTFVAVRRTAEPGDLAWQSVALGCARAETRAVEELISPPPEGTLPLSTGYLPPDLQASAELARCLARASSRPGVWDRLSLEGLEPLRSWFAGSVGGGFTACDVMICPGSKPAIAAAFRGLAAAGEPIVLESPTYIGAIVTARAAGLRIIPVATDDQGVRPDLLADALSRSGARLFYCQPTYANPTGAVLSDARRREVLEVASAARAFIVEDDWARDLHFGLHPAPPPLASHDRHGHVVYVRSLTKPAAPGLRVGALCARGAAFARLRGARAADDFYVSGPLQEAALQFVISPEWPRHLRRVNAALLERRDVLTSELSGRFVGVRAGVPQGGFHLWLPLPSNIDDAEAAQRCALEGVVVSPGSDWFPAEPSGPFLRLTFAGCDKERLALAATATLRVLHHMER